MPHMEKKKHSYVGGQNHSYKYVLKMLLKQDGHDGPRGK